MEALGATAAGLMDMIDEHELPEGAIVEEVMVIAAITWPAGAGSTGNSVFYSCTSGRP